MLVFDIQATFEFALHKLLCDLLAIVIIIEVILHKITKISGVSLPTRASILLKTEIHHIIMCI